MLHLLKKRFVVVLTVDSVVSLLFADVLRCADGEEDKRPVLHVRTAGHGHVRVQQRPRGLHEGVPLPALDRKNSLASVVTSSDLLSSY